MSSVTRWKISAAMAVSSDFHHPSLSVCNLNSR
jgi:hypothetical protein